MTDLPRRGRPPLPEDRPCTRCGSSFRRWPMTSARSGTATPNRIGIPPAATAGPRTAPRECAATGSARKRASHNYGYIHLRFRVT